MSKWNSKTLGELTSLMTKGIAPAYTDKVGADAVCVLNQKCNRGFNISYAESRLNDLSKKKVPEERYLCPGDVLINSTGTGTAGRVAQIWDIPCKTTIDGHMILLRSTDEIDPLYYGYAIKMHQGRIMSLAEGSTGQTEINRHRLCDEIVINYPIDRNEQYEIARILAAIDEKIYSNTKINDNLAA